MRRVKGDRLTAFQVGLIALVVLVVATFLAVSKDIPFTRPFELKAAFENAPPIQRGQAVRIAGVDVGKVSKVESAGEDSGAVLVTMKLERRRPADSRGRHGEGAPAHLLRGQPLHGPAARHAERSRGR